MGKEMKTRTVKPETHDTHICPMIVGEVKKSIPRMRTVKPKERIKFASMKSNSTTDKGTTTCVTSGNILKLCINLMPVLASAKEEEEEEKEVNSFPAAPENRSKPDQSVTKLVEQTPDTNDSYTVLTLKKTPEIKQQLTPGFVLPPLTQPKPAPEYCDHEKTKMCFTSLRPISLFEQTTTICPNLSVKGCKDDGDYRPWIDNPLLSRSRSAEFRLPEISLSSLETLLQTVTQKLVSKRRSSDEGPWRRIQSDHLLDAVNERRLREKMVEEQIDFCTTGEKLNNIAAAAETSVSKNRVRSQLSLPPLFSAPKPTLILSMTKKT